MNEELVSQLVQRVLVLDAVGKAEITLSMNEMKALLWHCHCVRAALDAVPVDSILYMIDPFANGGTDAATGSAHWQAIDAWAQAEKAKRVHP